MPEGYNFNLLNAGRNHLEPLPLFEKIVICKPGKYSGEHGIVIENRSRKLKVLIADGSVVYCNQDTTLILDPKHTLPFGIPIASTNIEN